MNNVEETLRLPQESYLGKEIENVVMEGSTKIFKEVKIFLMDGRCITMRAKLNISELGVVPYIFVKREQWIR